MQSIGDVRLALDGAFETRNALRQPSLLPHVDRSGVVRAVCGAHDCLRDDCRLPGVSTRLPCPRSCSSKPLVLLTRTLVLDATESAPLLASSPGGRSYLLLLRGTDLIAQDFDEASGTVAGDPVVLVSDIGQVASPAIRPSVGVSPWRPRISTRWASLRRQLAWVDRSGADVDRLPVDASVDFPQLSPDELFVAGSRLDSATSSDLWVTDLRRGASTRITFLGYAREVVWSPDGTRLAFRRPSIGSSGAPGIYVIGTDGANERQLTAENGGVTSWSTDGKYILYNSAGKLMMLDATGDGDPD